MNEGTRMTRNRFASHKGVCESWAPRVMMDIYLCFYKLLLMYVLFYVIWSVKSGFYVNSQSNQRLRNTKEI